jgi:hypothetical protein
MTDRHTLEDLIGFLDHASTRGLMPAATAQALAVATRNVFSVLDDAERDDVAFGDLDKVLRRFEIKRARDFTPETLREYGRRVRRAADLYLRWKADPANFTVKSRTTSARRRDRSNSRPRGSSGEMPTATGEVDSLPAAAGVTPGPAAPPSPPGTYQTSLPVRPGHVVTIGHIPLDLTSAEAERLAQFVRLLAPQ